MPEISIPKLLIGSDPEFFVRRNGHFIPAHDFGFGTKHRPMKTEHGFIQVDGLALECNIPPAETKEEFIRNTKNVLGDLSKAVKAKDKNMTLAAVPSVFFGHARLDSLPPEARKLGCEPDFNAYTSKANPRPDEGSEYRTGAGHVHLGWTSVVSPQSIKHTVDCRSLTRQLDFFLGLPSLLWDDDRYRRTLYGRAGAFRPKTYGLEYRVLSNRWLSSPKLVGKVFDQAQKAFRHWCEGQRLDNTFPSLAERIINENNRNWPSQYKTLAEIVL